MTKQLKQKRILTGDNPTGRLHLGHYAGSLQNRVKLQDEYETFIIIADLHAMAYPKYLGKPEVVADSVMQVAMDNLAVGLDPKKSKIFVESSVPQIYELAAIFSMLISHNRALRNPTLKDEIREKSLGDNYSMGFVLFPILQVADILCVNADLVPVGEDQVPHVELTREAARKFNTTYGRVFKEPEPLLSQVKRLIGTDGNAKMTKSIGNTIFLSEDDESLKQKVMSMFTDPKRIHPTDPGTVEGNPVFVYHDAFNPNKQEVEDLKERYRKGTVGDVEVKERLYAVLKDFLAPLQEKRRRYEKNTDEIRDILNLGNEITRKEAQKYLELAKEKMQLFK